MDGWISTLTDNLLNQRKQSNRPTSHTDSCRALPSRAHGPIHPLLHNFIRICTSFFPLFLHLFPYTDPQVAISYLNSLKPFVPPPVIAELLEHFKCRPVLHYDIFLCKCDPRRYTGCFNARRLNGSNVTGCPCWRPSLSVCCVPE